MSSRATTTASESLQLLRKNIPLELISLLPKQHSDAELAELVDYLVDQKIPLKELSLRYNRLTDLTGVKLARYVATSTTIQALTLDNNQFGEATYLAVASALRTNTSLQELEMFGNQAVDRDRIDSAFVEALRVNPNRSPESRWQLYISPSFFSLLSHFDDVDFGRLNSDACARSISSAAGPSNAESIGETDAWDDRAEQIRDLQASLQKLRQHVSELRVHLSREIHEKDTAQSKLANLLQIRSNLEEKLQQEQQEKKNLEQRLQQQEQEIDQLRAETIPELPKLNITVAKTVGNALGRGSSGSVYKVQLPDGRWAAAKTLFMFSQPELYQLFPGTPAFKQVVREFNREVRLLDLARHPNIVSLLGVVPPSQEHHRLTDNTETPEWIITELADITLDGLMNSVPDRRLLPQMYKKIALDVLNALAHVHHIGILHRDLKPTNVLLFRPDMTAKLCDFGGARLIPHGAQTMTTIGTPSYTAPEVASGRYGQQVDVYSFGVMFVEMLTGSVPSIQQSAADRQQQIGEQLATMTVLPAEFNELVVQAVHPDPAARCTVDQLRNGLDKIELPAPPR